MQTAAIATAIALSIVAGGLALRFKVASRQANKRASMPSSEAAQVNSASAAQANSATASSTAGSVNPQTASQAGLEAESVPPLAAISVTPIQPEAAEPTAAKPSHLPYEEADPSRLQPVGTFVRENFERVETLDFEAANAFILMVEEARADGINLMPISGFRTVAQQAELFAKQTERYGSETAAAQLSAPAEFSEHHTGYAVDIGDSDRPETDLDKTFADTAAYQWLLDNAYIFGFEQSFPQGNPQGLSFEPWHWRYVQSERATQVFSTARGAAKAPAKDFVPDAGTSASQQP